MIPEKPFNTKLLDVDKYISTNNIQEIKSYSIMSASSTNFHPEGLFSEEIFGQIGSPDRMSRFAFIRLNTRVFQPYVYKAILQLKQLYGQVMLGNVYAKFDEKERDIIRCDVDDPDGDTGYSFFMNHFDKIQFEDTGSAKRKQKIQMLTKYKDILTINKCLVIPAGIRDIKNENGMISQEDINKIYQTIMSFTSRLVPGSNNPLYDSIRMNLQKKVYELYTYIENILTGKRGFLQGAVGSRKIALGTRNVISAVHLKATSTDDPTYLKHDETKCPLYQTMKAFMPLVKYHLKVGAFDTIFSSGETQIPLVDKKTKKLIYVEVDSSEVEKFTASDAIDTMINKFKNKTMRDAPVDMKGADGKYYHLYLVYDKDDELILFRNIDDLKTIYGKDENEIDMTCVRPMTWVELMYIATYKATLGKHVFITRYPVLNSESCYPSRVHLITTDPSRVVKLKLMTDEDAFITLPEYPILGNEYIDSLVLHFCKLKGLTGDKRA
jgi:hypothetical protein